MNPPITSIDDTNIKISWKLPDSDYPIIAYEILILQKDNVTWREQELCLGNSNIIVTNRYC